MKRPSRKTLPEEVAEILANEIRDNRWGGVLPGYRSLGELLGVGRRAIQGALEILTTDRILLPANGTRARQINPDYRRTHSPDKRIRIVAPVEREELDFVNRSIITEFQLSLGREWNFEHRKTRAYHLKHPGKVLDQLVDRNPNCRWVFLSPTYVMARWAERSSLDIICLGGDVIGTSMRTLSVSASEIIATHTEQLLDLGHKRICIPFRPSSPEGTAKLNQRLSSLFTEHGVPFNHLYNLPTVRTSRSEGFWRLLEKLFASTPPTAIVATSVKWYLLIISYCQEKGINIPGDISLALQMDDPLVDWIRPKPPTIEFPIRRFVSKLDLWAARGPEAIPPGVTMLKPKFKNGQSIAPPPKRIRTFL